MTSPLEIKIALHYYCHPGDYDGGEGPHFESSAVRRMHIEFVERGLLRRVDGEPAEGEAHWTAAPALEVYVDALCAVPWPVQEWVIPKVEV